MRKTKSKHLIMKSAEKLFSEKGYDETSIDEITKGAGIAKSLFFYYFEKKSDVLKELMILKTTEAFRDFLSVYYLDYIPESKEDVFYIISEFVKKNHTLFKAALFEFIKTNAGMDFMSKFPDTMLRSFRKFFEFGEEDYIKIIVYTVRTIMFDSICENVCSSFGVDEEFVSKCTMDVSGSGLFGQENYPKDA